MTEELEALFGAEEPNIQDLGAFIDAHPELGFKLRPSYLHDRGIMMDATVRACSNFLDGYTVIVARGLFGPFGAEWDAAIGESVEEIAVRVVAAGEQARGLRGRHLVVQV